MLAACSSPDPVLYTIAPAPGATQISGPSIVLLDQIEVARYLDRSQIVKSSDDYRLEIKANDWWGEPLGAMVRRILRQELTQRLPQSTILSESAAVSATPDASIDLDLQRLDENASGNVVLLAEASVTFKGRAAPLLRRFQFIVPSSGPDTGSEVAAITVAVGKLADGLAAMVAGR
jgi:uncharacterized protein